MARSQWCPHPHDQHTHHWPRDSGAKVSQHLWGFSSVTGVLMKFSCGGKVCVTIICLKEMQCKRFSEHACQPLFPPCLSPAAIFSCYLCVYVCELCMSCVCVSVVHVCLLCAYLCVHVCLLCAYLCVHVCLLCAYLCVHVCLLCAYLCVHVCLLCAYLCVHVYLLCAYLCVHVCLLCAYLCVPVVCIFVCACVHTSFQVPSDKKIKNLKQDLLLAF